MAKIHPNLNLFTEHTYFEFGWFPDSDFALFKIALLELYSKYPKGIGLVVIFSIQIAKFCISFELDNS